MNDELARHTEKLYYFYMIALEGSLQAASRRIGVSAPSLSISLKQLEGILGPGLFLRTRSGMNLTDAGRSLFQFCQKYYRELTEVEQHLQQPLAPRVQKIRIGTCQSLALHLWPLLIESIKGPYLSISMRADRSRIIHDALIRQEIDFALTVDGLKHEKIAKHKLSKDAYAFYKSTFSGTNLVKDAELAKSTLLYTPDAADEQGKSLKYYIHFWNLRFKDEVELDSFEAVKELTRKGHGIGILPTKLHHVAGGDLKQVKIEAASGIEFGPHHFYFSHRTDLDVPAPLLSSFFDIAKRAVNNLNSC